MSDKFIGAAVAMGVFVLILGLTIPAIVAAPTNTIDYTTSLSESGEETIDNKLAIRLNEANGTQGTANVTLTDVETNQSLTETLTQNETETVELRGESINLTLGSPTMDSVALLTVGYPSMYSLDGPARIFIENFSLLIVILSFLFAIGLLWWVVS